MIILALLTEVTANLLKVTPGIIGDVKNNWPTNGFVSGCGGVRARGRGRAYWGFAVGCQNVNPSGITTFESVHPA